MPGTGQSNAQDGRGQAETVTSNWGAMISRAAAGSLQYLATQYLDSSSITPEVLSGAAGGGGDALFDDVQEEEEEEEEDDENEDEEQNDDDDAVNKGGYLVSNSADDKDSVEDVLAVSEQDLGSRGFEVVELDVFNSNPSMEFVIYIIDKLEDMNCSGKLSSDEQWTVEPFTASSSFSSVATEAQPSSSFRVAKGSMPTWMNILLSVVRNDKATATSASGYPMSSRLFALRIVINRPKVFAPFAKHWIEPILSVCVESDLGSGDHQPRRGFHYLLRDVCRLLEYWNCSDLPITRCAGGVNTDAKTQAKAFLSHLCKVCVNSVPSVLHNNIGHIRRLMELWRNHGGAVFDPCPIWDLFMCRGKGKDADWVKVIWLA